MSIWLTRLAVVVVASSGLALGCGDDQDATPPPVPPDEMEDCPPGTYALDERCEPAGIPTDLECAPGDVRLDDGRCEPAGLPGGMPCPPGQREGTDRCIPAGQASDECAPGFQHDGDVSCLPILPSETCPAGMLAIPGDTACHEIADCGAGPWGDIPVDLTTQYVDAEYAVGDSDGTELKPWPTIQAGLNAASPGATVAVAAGSYPEDLLVTAPARLWGRCPAMVSVTGQGAPAAIRVDSSAGGAEIRGLSVTGPGTGIRLLADACSLSALHVHDAGGVGVDVVDVSLELTGCLLEGNVATNLSAETSTVDVMSSVSRGALHDPGGELGHGLMADASSVLTVRSSVVEGSADVGVWVNESEGNVIGSVLRESGGRGSCIRRGTALRVTDSLVEENGESGLYVLAASATITGSVIRRNGWYPSLNLGGGIVVTSYDNGDGSTASVLRTVIEQNEAVGLSVQGSDVTIEDSALRGQVTPSPGDPAGGAVVAAGALTLRRCSLSGNDQLGLDAVGSEIVVEDSEIVDSTGFGISAILSDGGAPSTATVRRSRITRNEGGAVLALSSSLVIDRSELGLSKPMHFEGEPFQLELFVAHLDEAAGPMSLLATGSRIDLDASAATAHGIVVDGAEATVDQCAVEIVGIGPGSSVLGLFSTESQTGVAAAVSLARTKLEHGGAPGIFASGTILDIDESHIKNAGDQPTALDADGIFAATDTEHGVRSNVTLSRSLVEGSTSGGIVLFGTDALIEYTAIVDTAPNAAGEFGDGVSALPDEQGNVPTVRIVSSMVRNAARGGLATFAASLSYEGTAVLCPSFDIIGEQSAGLPFLVEPLGRNGCGCPEPTDDCLLESAGFAAPAAPSVSSPW